MNCVSGKEKYFDFRQNHMIVIIRIFLKSPYDLCLTGLLVAFAIFAATFSGLALISCSQKRITVHPSRLRIVVTVLSRARLRASFAAQNELFVFGFVLCAGHPCQKQPSQKTATRGLGNTKSGRPVMP